MTYRIYTDGSTRGNGKENAVGGWAYVVVDENANAIFQCVGSEVGTTNQRMELTAALEGLKYCLNIFQSGDNFILYTDSAYLHNCYDKKWYEGWLKNGWKNSKKEPVANRDLWEQLTPFFGAWGFDFCKVKGHTDGKTEHEKWNNYVDVLAQSEATRRKQLEEE